MNEIEPQTLECGKTIEELSEYLSADRTPYDPIIEKCPECLNALQALAQMAQLSRELIARDAVDLPALPENWLSGLMSNIRAEVRSGRSLPLPHPDPRVALSVTEGAVRAVIRSIGDEVPGLVIGTSQLEGSADQLGAPVVVTVTASIAWGHAIPDAASTVRARIYAVLATHTALNVQSVNVIIEDLHGYEPEHGRETP